MLNVTTAIKNMFKHDYLPYNAPVEKSLVLYFADLNLTITEDDIYNDEFEWNSELTGEELTFGDCNSDSLKFSVEGVTEDIVGHQFTAKFVIGGVDYKIGTFIVSEAKCEDNNDFKKVVAYDLMRKFDVDVAAWYEALTFPITLKSMRESLCTQCGVQYNNSNLPNDSLSISKTISTNQLNGRDVLKSLEQLNGCFGHMDRNGLLGHIVLSQSSPVDEIDNTAYDELVLEEYTTDAISKVQIRQEDGDVGAYSGTGTNCYTITGNFLVYGKSAAELSTIANNVATNILGITYRPFECEMQGLLYLDAGDYITFSGSDTVNTYFLKRTLTGAQILSDKATAKGDKVLSEDTSLNVQVIQLKGKTNVLRRDVDGLSNTVTNLDTAVTNQGTTITNMQTSISQNSERIVQEVSARVSLRNSIVGSNVCDNNPIESDDICNTDVDTIVDRLSMDSTAKMELLANKFSVDLADNVNQLQASINFTNSTFKVALEDNVNQLQTSIELTNTSFTTQIANLTNNTSTQIQQLANEISLKLTTSDLCNELSISTDGINITGNRFTWSATNSSMTADGTLTCRNGYFTGTITSSIFTAGALGGLYTYINQGYVETNYLRIYDDSSANAIVDINKNGVNFNGGASYGSYSMKATLGTLVSLNVTNINGGTPITSNNIGQQSVSTATSASWAEYSDTSNTASTASSVATGYLTLSGGTLIAPSGSLYIGQNTVKANTITQLSSKRFKKEIADYTESALEIICDSKIKSYRYNNEPDQSTIERYKSLYPGYDFKKHIGLIVEESNPCITTQCGDGLDLGIMIAIAWKGMQELQEEIKEIRRNQNGN